LSDKTERLGAREAVVELSLWRAPTMSLDYPGILFRAVQTRVLPVASIKFDAVATFAVDIECFHR
jgi:hypothetical protein